MACGVGNGAGSPRHVRTDPAATADGDDRDCGLAYGHTSMSSLPAEAMYLDDFIVDGLQGDVTLLTTFRGTCFAWSDANRSTGPDDALRASVAFLLHGS